MPNVKIVTDSLADIPAPILKELDITTIPCVVRFGDHEFHDRVDLFPSEFYQKLRHSPVLPSTSQPAIGVFEDMYRKLSESTNQILAIHTIASLSGIYNASRVAAENVKTARIELIDSRQVTMSLGWLVIQAARAAKDGHSLDEIKQIVEDTKNRVHIIAMLDTLEYAQRGGRLGKGKALVGTLLNVKPLLSVIDGEIMPVENVRTQKRALQRLVEIVLGSGPIQELSVIHAEALDHAKTLREMLAETFPEEHIVMSETGPVLGSHVGPGAVGIAWITGKY
ncbi:MAG: DegV family protein [Chloroflexi bacterium]|nr:DegV family protein [Chloroflexota bacterium]